MEQYRARDNRSLYSKYNAMKARCYRKAHIKYAQYGGRGITICEAWRNSFSAFAEWAYSHGYSDDMTIERINVDGNYCPENCKWIPAREQAYNKTNTIMVDYHGERISLARLCQRKGINYQSVHFRLNHMGMSVEDAIDTPFRENVTEIARKCHEHNIPIKVVKDRMHKLGWDEDRALNTPVRKIKKADRRKVASDHADQAR